MKKFTVQVAQDVEVTLDESRFTPEFMENYRKNFYPFNTLEDHAKHLAELAADGRIPLWNESAFVEGYGALKASGVKLEITYTEVDLLVISDS